MDQTISGVRAASACRCASSQSLSPLPPDRGVRLPVMTASATVPPESLPAGTRTILAGWDGRVAPLRDHDALPTTPRARPFHVPVLSESGCQQSSGPDKCVAPPFPVCAGLTVDPACLAVVDLRTSPSCVARALPGLASSLSGSLGGLRTVDLPVGLGPLAQKTPP